MNIPGQKTKTLINGIRVTYIFRKLILFRFSQFCNTSPAIDLLTSNVKPVISLRQCASYVMGAKPI